MRLAILAILAIGPLLALGAPPKSGQGSATSGQPKAINHPRSVVSGQKTDSRALRTSNLSARCVSIGETPDERVSPRPAVAPGAPPLLSFRYYEGVAHHQFNHSDLMLDDAGH